MSIQKLHYENDAAHHKALAESALRVAKGWEGKCDELRAKIEAMEKQEPAARIIGTVTEWVSNGDGTYSLGGCVDAFAPLPDETKLYTLPGAQPAPSVPTALLVAVADLVAQMEIVSRVGFVDTPNDKDSCAAFCIAEGTWLELVSAIESLAAALAAAPEVKP